MLTRNQIAKNFGDEWVDFMVPFVQSAEFEKILTDIKAEKDAGKKIFPEPTQVFRCFKELPLSQVRIVIIGQDPYPVEGYANGLAFSHSMERKISASLDKVIDCIEKDCYNGLDFDKQKFDTELTSWVQQGVLLLNTALTVVEKVPGSHAEIWKPFTQYVLKTLSDTRRNLIFLSWGKDATVFTQNIHFVTHFNFTAEHPSFAAREKRDWDCHHFSIVNTVIGGNKLGELIKW